jgi:hypothetical protein
MMTLREKHVAAKLLIAAKKSSRKCHYPGCGENAIKSHLLQEHGVLDKIAERGHFVQMSQPEFFHQLRFEKKGVNATDVMAYKGFCSTHDSSLFDEIETPPSDFKKYRHQLLLSYRGLVNQCFKYEYLLDFHEKMLASSEITEKTKDEYVKLYKRATLWLSYFNDFKKQVEQELFHARKDKGFVFHHFELPKVGLATSSVTIDPRTVFFKTAPSVVFFNLIPTQDTLLFVLGYSRSTELINVFDIHYLDGISQASTFKLINELLVDVETFCMSLDMYKYIVSKDLANHLIAGKSPHRPLWTYTQATPFNIFDGIVKEIK